MKPVFLLFAIVALLLPLYSCGGGGHEYLIGVSQCSDDDWRTQLNNEIRREAQFYNGVSVEIRAANDDNARQMRDIEELVHMGADLLIVSPNVVDDVSPAIERAYRAGIPVILVDRRTRSEECTAYVGADNYDIGRRAGEYVVNRLDGNGMVVEITGLSASTPAIDRHQGFMDAIKDVPGIVVEATADACWDEKRGEVVFDSILGVLPHIDLVFAHNDRMAAGAYRAARRHGREHEMLFIGVDALPGEGRGVDMVAKGELDATFIYPTGGDKVVQVAMNILQGKPYEYKNMLSTALVNKANARIMQMQMAHISTLDEKIETLDSRLDAFLMRYSVQRILLVLSCVVLVLVLASLFFVVRAYWTKKRLNAELSRQKQQLEQRRDQLIDMSKQLEEATHAKLKFFTNISHDFRTPLTLIAAPVEQLSESKSLGDDERFLLGLVKKNVTVLLRLVNQLLDFRKYEEGKLAVHPCRFDIGKEIMGWTDAFKSLSYSKHIHFKVVVDTVAEGYEIVADIEKIERIVYNLLSNAFKYTPGNGSVTVALSRGQMAGGNDCVCLKVEDTGIGIPAGSKSNVFDDFYQVDDLTGSGIGLALVKAFVDLHHGEIDMESVEGKGSVFSVKIPVHQDWEVGERSAATSAKMENLREGAVLAAGQATAVSKPLEMLGGDAVADGGGRETILVIDDNEDIRSYMKLLLGQEYNVIEAANGQDGLVMAMKYVPDVVVCDAMMPVMDGMECCRRLKSELQTSHIPVLMLTAYAMDEYELQGYENGADAYMAKPFNARILLARVRNLLDNRRRLQKSLASHQVPGQDGKGGEMGGMDKNFMEKLYSQIEEHLADADYNVEAMGAQVGLSRVQLYRKTKALTGYSPNELLRMARLKRAAKLLASTDKTVAEVGYAVGFASPSYFAKCYKECYGENPTDFIRRKQGGGEVRQ